MTTRKYAAWILLVAALAACAPEKAPETNSRAAREASSIPTTAPSITGTVTVVGPGRTMLIEERPAEESGSAKAQVEAAGDAAIWDRGSGSRRTFEDIEQGAILSAWFTGPVAESYPVQATAGTLVIERTPPHEPTSSDAKVDAMGFGAIRVGMTLAEAERAAGAPLALLGPKMDPCYYVVAPGRPGVAFMIIEGRVARVDVMPQAVTIRTAEGAGIGDPEGRIHALYPGRVEVQPHKYVDGNYLIVRPAAAADSSYRIIFETDGKRVTSYRAGRMPEVRWVEGCS